VHKTKRPDWHTAWRRLGSADGVAVGALTLAFVVVLTTFEDYGITWDEDVHRIYGELIVEYYRSDFQDTRALGFSNLWLYGGLYDAIVALVVRWSRLGIYETRHLVNALTGLVGVVGAWRLARIVGGARCGAIATVLLLLMPRYYGHMFNNPKDLPFAVGYVWSLVCLARLLPVQDRVRWPALIGFGVAAGATMAVRAGGIILFAYLGLVVAAGALVRLRTDGPRRWLRGLPQHIAYFLVPFALAYSLALLAWPWAQQQPMTRFVEALQSLSRFPHDVEMLFGGRVIRSTDLPLSYIPTWLLITLPEIVLVLLVAGAGALTWSIMRKRAGMGTVLAQRIGMLIFTVVFPLGYAVIREMVLYDELRHFLFVLPVLAVIAAVTADHLWKLVQRRSRHKKTIGALLVAYAVYHLVLLVQYHPYQYTYFNRVIGGLPGAHGRFDTDYWGHSYKEAVGALATWVNEHAPTEPGRRYGVAVCSAQSQASYYFPPSFFDSRADQADFFMATTLWGCHERYPKPRIATVERFGVPLSVVIDMRADAQAESAARRHVP
jgi:hypothetical protein